MGAESPIEWTQDAKASNCNRCFCCHQELSSRHLLAQFPCLMNNGGHHLVRGRTPCLRELSHLG